MPSPTSPTAEQGDLGSLTTESVAAERADIDTWTTEQLVLGMNTEDAVVPAAISRQLGPIAEAIDAVAARMSRGGRLFYVGAGTPGRIGVLDASEAPPTFGIDEGDIVGVIAGGARAVFTAVENAEDDEAAGAADLAHHSISPMDSVVGLSASGRTPYVAGALRYALEVGALTVAVACNEGSLIGELAEHRIEVVVGPEFISGSTRLKSGTAQKLVLNMISTITMIKLGKTYGSLMMDLKATNHKLRARAENMLMQISGSDRAEAQSALHATGYSVKEAALVLMIGLTPSQARRRLADHAGRFRTALNAPSR
jgi:N-acetylmuramic acid 6-phosphate etherase